MSSLPIIEFLFLLNLACNREIRGRVSLSDYDAAFMCHTRGNLKSESISLNPTLLFSKCVSLGTLTFVCLVFLYVPKFARIKTWLTGFQVPSTGSNFSVLPGLSSNNQKQQDIALTFITDKNYENYLLLQGRTDIRKGQNQRVLKGSKIVLWHRKPYVLRHNIYFLKKRGTIMTQ